MKNKKWKPEGWMIADYIEYAISYAECPVNIMDENPAMLGLQVEEELSTAEEKLAEDRMPILMEAALELVKTLSKELYAKKEK